MKKILLLTALLFLTISLHGQITKTIEIYNKQGAWIAVFQSIDEDSGEILNHHFAFIGRDYQYQHITESITIISNSASEVYRFLSEIEKFNAQYKKDGGIGKTIMGVRAKRIFMYGMGVTWLYDPDGNGYTQVTDKQYGVMKKAIANYCNKYSVKYE